MNRKAPTRLGRWRGLSQRVRMTWGSVNPPHRYSDRTLGGSRTARKRALPKHPKSSPGASSGSQTITRGRAITLAWRVPTRRPKPRTFLGLFLAQHLAGFQIDQMHAGTSHALERLVGLIIVGHLIGGPPLHVLAGVWTTIEECPRHQTKLAQTKGKAPARRAAGAKLYLASKMRAPERIPHVVYSR